MRLSSKKSSALPILATLWGLLVFANALGMHRVYPDRLIRYVWPPTGAFTTAGILSALGRDWWALAALAAYNLLAWGAGERWLGWIRAALRPGPFRVINAFAVGSAALGMAGWAAALIGLAFPPVVAGLAILVLAAWQAFWLVHAESRGQRCDLSVPQTCSYFDLVPPARHPWPTPDAPFTIPGTEVFTVPGNDLLEAGDRAGARRWFTARAREWPEFLVPRRRLASLHVVRKAGGG